MNKNTILNLLDIFETAATSHPSVSQFETGDTSEVSQHGDADPLYVFLEMPYQFDSGIGNTNMREYNLAFLFLDIPHADGRDTQKAISRADMLSGYFFAYLDQNHAADLSIVGTVNSITLTNYNGDAWAGVRCEVTIQTRLPFDGCDPKLP